MEQYVVVLEDSIGEFQHTEKKGVYPTLEEAKKDFKHFVYFVKGLSDGYNKVVDTDICFSAYLRGRRDLGHTNLYIEKVGASPKEAEL